MKSRPLPAAGRPHPRFPTVSFRPLTAEDATGFGMTIGKRAGAC
jgi:hypothetical protein